MIRNTTCQWDHRQRRNHTTHRCRPVCSKAKGQQAACAVNNICMIRGRTTTRHRALHRNKTTRRCKPRTVSRLNGRRTPAVGRAQWNDQRRRPPDRILEPRPQSKADDICSPAEQQTLTYHIKPDLAPPPDVVLVPRRLPSQCSLLQPMRLGHPHTQQGQLNQSAEACPPYHTLLRQLRVTMPAYHDSVPRKGRILRCVCCAEDCSQ